MNGLLQEEQIFFLLRNSIIARKVIASDGKYFE